MFHLWIASAHGISDNHKIWFWWQVAGTVIFENVDLLFDELFELFDEKLSDHLDFVPLDPFYRFHFAA